MSGDPKDPPEVWVVISDKDNAPLLVEPIDSDTVERTENRNAYLASIGMLGSRHHVTPYVPKVELDRVTAELELARAVCEMVERFCVELGAAKLPRQAAAAYELVGIRLARWKESRSRG